MHAEIEPRGHDEQGEDGRERPRPFLFQPERGREKQPRAHLRMTAGKRHIFFEIHRRKKGRIDLDAGDDALGVGAEPGNDALEKGVDRHRGKGNEHELFSEFLVHEPVNDGNQCHQYQRFPEQGKGAGEEGGERGT